MKTRLLIAFLLFAGILHAQDNNPFLQLSYDSIVIYDFEPRSKKHKEQSIINDSNALAGTIKKFKTLTPTESKRLSEALGKKESFGKDVAACFEPHLGIVYYKNGKPTAHVTVCIDCNRLESSLDIPNQKQGKQVSEEGDVYYTATGMSKKLRMHLNGLLKKYHFSHTITGESIFDN